MVLVDWQRWVRPLSVGAIVAGALMWLVWLASGASGDQGLDAHAYYFANLGRLYDGSALGARGAYLYSPVFAQVLEPLRSLNWPVFRDLVRLLETVALFVLVGPLGGPLLFFLPVATEVATGNVNLLIAVAVVAGFRWPAAWSFVLLTKVTPGIGLLWFAVRREWSSLAIALAATATIVAVSAVIDPGDWVAWARLLGSSDGMASGQVITAPLLLRLPAAAAIVAWGAHTDRRWLVPVAVFVAMPATWPATIVLLLGTVPLRSADHPARPAPPVLRGSAPSAAGARSATVRGSIRANPEPVKGRRA
jgi:hypothetical protein